MSDQSADAILEALGEPVRRRLVERLQAGPSPVGRLAEGLPVGRPAVSKHLKVLEEAGVVEHRAVGTRNLYALAPGGLAPLQQWLVGTWDGGLAAFRTEVEQEAKKQKGQRP